MKAANKTKRTAQVILCTVFLTAAFSLVQASDGTADIKFAHRAAGYNTQIWGGGVNSSAFSGMLVLNKSNNTGTGNMWLNGDLAGFCIELNQTASSSTHKYDVVMPQDAQLPQTFLGGPIDTVKAAYISELWQENFDPAWLTSNTSNNHKAASFQAALWEIIYEDLSPTHVPLWDVTLDGTTGSHGFRCTGLNDGGVLANGWLNALDMQGPHANLRALVDASKQDYLVHVPEPAALALFGLGAALMLRRRK